uniref:Uncharacterized protein n=1 Tax=Denticeps clupeoides TaxID=299321 RepID=A0AAY4BPU1_9TELE
MVIILIALSREKLHESLQKYVFDTLTYIDIVSEFCNKKEKWFLQREIELDMMRDIKDRYNKIHLSFDHVTHSKTKTKAFREYLWSGLTQITADTRSKALEKELRKVLEDTLKSLEKLDDALNAVEKLAVTSLFVFYESSYLPQGVSCAAVRSIISAARLVFPLLIHFKRNAEAFFCPSFHNVEVMAFQLNKYISTTKELFSSFSFIILQMKKLNHKNDPMPHRTNPDLRLTMMFQDKAQHFSDLINQHHSRMLQFLSDLEESAVQLDRMKMGASISTVAVSSVGMAGGVLSIVGLALAPVTAGVSLALTLTGVGLGVTSGANSLVTGITEMAVNKYHGKSANGVFKKYMEDVETITSCLDQVAKRHGPIVKSEHLDIVVGARRVMTAAGCVGKGIDMLVDGVSAVKVLQTEEVAATAVRLGLQDVNAGSRIPSLAADLPEIGQLAKGTPLALSKAARAGAITLNALFIGMDVLFICKDSISLAKGSESEVSKLIRSRVGLWRSEQESWKKISDCLSNWSWRFNKYHRILEQPFYPVAEV